MLRRQNMMILSLFLLSFLLVACGDESTGPELNTFDPNAEVIFPGNLLQGGSLGGSAPDPIVLDRAPGTITINLVNGSQAVSADVDVVRNAKDNTLVNVKVATGRREEGRALLEKAAPVLKMALPGGHPRVVEVREQLEAL